MYVRKPGRYFVEASGDGYNTITRPVTIGSGFTPIRFILRRTGAGRGQTWVSEPAETDARARHAPPAVVDVDAADGRSGSLPEIVATVTAGGQRIGYLDLAVRDASTSSSSESPTIIKNLSGIYNTSECILHIRVPARGSYSVQLNPKAYDYAEQTVAAPTGVKRIPVSFVLRERDHDLAVTRCAV